MQNFGLFSMGKGREERGNMGEKRCVGEGRGGDFCRSNDGEGGGKEGP